MIRAGAQRSPLKRFLAVVLALLLVGPAGAAGQSVLNRTPNLEGGWVSPPGTIHFNFLHRFSLLGPDNDNVANSPTFLLTAPLPGPAMLGARYASDSRVAAGEPNEWELFGRWSPLRAGEGDAPVDLSLTAAWNATAGSADGEVSLGVPAGPLRLLGVGRVFSDAYGQGEAGWAAGGGAVLGITDGIALAGDVVASSDRPADRTVAWGAALQLRVPLTPHTLSLQATNTRTATLQGASLGHEERESDADVVVWGFEFTIPFTLSRYFGGGGPGPDRDEAAGAGEGQDTAVELDPEGATVVTMTDDLRFGPSTVRIRAGQTVVWRNPTPLVHTVTADPERAVRSDNVALPDGAETFDSGDLRPGESFRYRFRVPGEYLYVCVPHELAGMVGRVVVTP